MEGGKTKILIHGKIFNCLVTYSDHRQKEQAGFHICAVKQDFNNTLKHTKLPKNTVLCICSPSTLTLTFSEEFNLKIHLFSPKQLTCLYYKYSFLLAPFPLPFFHFEAPCDSGKKKRFPGT